MEDWKEINSQMFNDSQHVSEQDLNRLFNHSAKKLQMRIAMDMFGILRGLRLRPQARGEYFRKEKSKNPTPKSTTYS